MRGWAIGLGLTALMAATTACGKKEESRAEADRAAAKAGFVPPSVTSRVDFGSMMARRFRELDREAMLSGVTANMVTPIELVQQTVDGMVERQFGRIVNITSVSVKMPVLGLDLSSGARAGLTAFMAGVSRSVASSNVTINNLLPGFIDTDRFRDGINANAQQLGKSPADMRSMREQQVPAGRIGAPSDFGEACAFLCSAQAGYITGQNLLMDGGLFNAAF